MQKLSNCKNGESSDTNPVMLRRITCEASLVVVRQAVRFCAAATIVGGSLGEKEIP